MKNMISLENITVSYQHTVEHVASFKEYVIRKLKNRMKYEYFHALKNVSLEVREGEVFGLIGHNGAGKSTLLKVVARVLKPTEGRLQLHGRVFPLLELGAGFDPELTGRENVYLNSAILGFKKADIQKRFDRIVAFAGLEEFIDAPVRNYSTGMVSRLGFSIATDVQPEILIIDEVLSVGDTDFQKQSENRIQSFCRSGTTILLVSHDLDSIQKMCNRVALLEHGQIKAVGNTKDILHQYTLP
jgi:ABC-2 type transport system ATP-binding protein